MWDRHLSKTWKWTRDQAIKWYLEHLDQYKRQREDLGKQDERKWMEQAQEKMKQGRNRVAYRHMVRRGARHVPVVDPAKGRSGHGRVVGEGQGPVGKRRVPERVWETWVEGTKVYRASGGTSW